MNKYTIIIIYIKTPCYYIKWKSIKTDYLYFDEIIEW
jgi:hypothetical protein